MKIYGQSFGDIFDSLPWQYKIVVAVGSVFILFVLVYIPAQLLRAGIKPPAVEPLQISSSRQPAAGVFDPSLAYDPRTQTAWMAYTSEEASQNNVGGKLLHVRIAKTSAGPGECKKWSQAGGGFEGKPDDLMAPDGQTVFRSGAWRVETPTLVYDPDDPGREWKLYAYKYFWAQDPEQTLAVAQHYGVIAYKYATDPAKEWSAEQWLFSPAPDYPPEPYEQMILLHLNRLDKSLQNVVAYSRPSAVYKDGALVMTLSAFTEGSTPDRVIMIVSRDHGDSWLYVGAPLQKFDLSGMGAYTRLAGATLIEEGGKVYLAAVLGDVTKPGLGTFIFGFADLSRGILHRDSKTGAPAVLRQLPLHSKDSGTLGGGFAAYTEACPFGLLTAEQTRGAASFQIFKTYKKPVEK